MSASERLATMPAMTAFSRAGLLAALGLEVAQLLVRGTPETGRRSWDSPAPMLLPSACMAGRADLRGDALRLAASWAEACPDSKAAAARAASAKTRIILP